MKFEKIDLAKGVKIMKNIFKIITIEVFDTDVIVSINQTDNQLYNCVSHKFTREDFDNAYYDWTSGARTVTHNNGFVIVRYRDRLNKEPKTIGIVAHESYHAAFSILNRIGVQPHIKTEEVYAYLTQYIVTETFKQQQQ
jgi:hypothetical protein